MSPVGGSKLRGTRTARAAGGILVALASEFWGLGCPRIYNEVATLSLGWRAVKIEEKSHKRIRRIGLKRISFGMNAKQKL